MIGQFSSPGREAGRPHTTAFVCDVDSGDAADLAALLHAFSLGFHPLLELLLACCLLGFGWLL
jgi:hypothetical protein